MIKSISIIFRTLRIFWATSLAGEVEYRLNLFVECFSVIGNLSGSLFVLYMFYSNGKYLGGWNWNSSLVVLGFYYLLEGFTIILLQPNLTRIVRHIQQGSLDFILLKPIDSQFWLSSRMISPWGIPSLLAGLILIARGIYMSVHTMSISSILAALTMLISSLAILYSLWFLIATTSIWFVKIWNANEVLRSVLVAGRYPISAYPEVVRAIFTFILPVAFLTTIPAETLLGKSYISWMSSSIMIALILFLTSRAFWKYALRFYTSASS